MQEYDPRTFDIEPQLDTWDEFERVLYGSFRRAGAHPHVGRHLPHLFAAAGLGSPDGTDVAGLLTPLQRFGERRRPGERVTRQGRVQALLRACSTSQAKMKPPSPRREWREP
jgi:hypothetical protein